MPTQSQPTALPKHTHYTLRTVPSLDGSGATAHEIETEGHTIAHIYPDTGEEYADKLLTTLNSHAALVAENKRLREALTDCIDRLDHHDDQSVPEVVNARAALSGVLESEWPYITPGMEARAALAKGDV